MDRFVDMLLAAAEKGLSNIQFNTIDAETLINAQKHPERYNNLAVRVSGFSQKFNLLERHLQNHIIERNRKDQAFMHVGGKANIFNISRGSVHDGLGIRTVVYFKGCNLHCKWRHNPEGISFKKQILFVENKCIGCNRCNNKTDPGACPSKALSTVGDEMTLDEVYSEIAKDRHYYAYSGGGVTFSRRRVSAAT